MVPNKYVKHSRDVPDHGKSQIVFVNGNMRTFFKLLCFGVYLFLGGTRIFAQHYTSASIFAHNDYVRSNPFHTAYNLRVGYIEADVFLVDNALLVAHTRLEINPDKTLERLYLEPLR